MSTNGRWVTVRNAREFLEVKGNKRQGAHNFTGKIGRTIPWPYCVNCGLVLLKNQTTRQAAKKSCEWYED